MHAGNMACHLGGLLAFSRGQRRASVYKKTTNGTRITQHTRNEQNRTVQFAVHIGAILISGAELDELDV